MIDRVEKLSVGDFRKLYLANSKPVIIRDIIEDWPARKLWCPDYFASKFYHVPLRVERLDEDRGSDAEYFLENVRSDSTTIGEFLEAAQSTENDGRLYAAMLALADVQPELQNDVGVLPYYSDKLRRLAGQKANFWMGPAGCVAALHIDPLHNFAVQVYGRKKWMIFPSAQLNALYIPSQLKSPHFSPVNVEAPDLDRFPNYREATPMEFTLDAGEVLFLPRGWGHHVRSMTFSISLNFWWVTLGWQDITRIAKNRLMRLRRGLKK